MAVANETCTFVAQHQAARVGREQYRLQDGQHRPVGDEPPDKSESAGQRSLVDGQLHRRGVP
jgi:hypothetical protein